ncbi:MAG TPA: hypothetical protein VK204_02100 [Nocardioidaceae bacterium]|nr:hypothetical protein [Nocardioidaceae bacterium]
MDGGQPGIEDRAQHHAAAVRAAMRSVRREVRGLPLDAATERLTRALRERDVYVPPSQLRSLARHLADPWWLLKHPIRGRRELRLDARAGADPESLRLEREADGVGARQA